MNAKTLCSCTFTLFKSILKHAQSQCINWWTEKKTNKQFTNKFLKMEKNWPPEPASCSAPSGVARMVPLDIDRSHPVVGGWQRESALMRVGDMNFKVREVFQQLVKKLGWMDQKRLNSILLASSWIEVMSKDCEHCEKFDVLLLLVHVSPKTHREIRFGNIGDATNITMWHVVATAKASNYIRYISHMITTVAETVSKSGWSNLPFRILHV